MGRHQTNKKQSLNEDLNFRFSTPAPSQQLQQQQRPRSNSYNRRNNASHQTRSTPQDRTSARRKANSAMFYLHNSADHVFFLTRQNSNKLSNTGAQHSFTGSDNPVAWEAVRIVKEIVPLQTKTTTRMSFCPICLDDFSCARITKCGHAFCLPCILHHVHSSTNPNHHVKCPCCSIPILINDLRPVQFESKIQPQLQEPIRLIKLHREKSCPTPYLPMPGFDKHSSPNAIPCMGEPDESYSRFNYIDPMMYQALLEANQDELKRYEVLVLSSKEGNNGLEHFFVQMSLERLDKEIKQAKAEFVEEMRLKETFKDPIKGFYQLQPSNKELLSIVEPSHDNNHPSTIHSHQKQLAGSAFLNESTTFQFYQAEDGQLIFLNGFNMTCLLSDFSRTDKKPARDNTNSHSTATQHNNNFPLPDSIRGRILEMERKNLTPELRKRLSFLSHLPLLTDITFVELDMNHLLTDYTKQKFKHELTKRRKRRQSKVKAEKRADRAAQKEETERINERRARLQLIDPDDDFFHSTAVDVEDSISPQDFNVPLTGSSQDRTIPNRIPSSPPGGMSFSEACRRDDQIIVTTSLDAFPTLDSAFSTLASEPVSGADASNSPEPRYSASSTNTGSFSDMALDKVTTGIRDMSHSPRREGKNNRKKSKGGKQRLLFSTGGQRPLGYY